MEWINRMLRRPRRAELDARKEELESGIRERDSALAEQDAEMDRLRTRLAELTDDDDGLRGSLAQAEEELVELLRRARANDVEGRLDFKELEESMLKGSHKLASALLGETLGDIEAVPKPSEVACPRCSAQMRFECGQKHKIHFQLGYLEKQFKAWWCDECGYQIRPRELEDMELVEYALNTDSPSRTRD